MKRTMLILVLSALMFGALDQPTPLLSDTGQPVNGMIRATLLVFSQAEGGDIIWTGTTDGSLPALKMANGYIHNIDQVIPGYVRDRGELWIEILIDGRSAAASRIHYISPESPLHREIPADPGDDPADPGDDPADPGDDPADPGDITETLTDELQIGLPGDELYVASATTGFGVDAPVERVDVDGAIGLKKGTVPIATTEYGKLYVNDIDGHLNFIDESGNITDLTVDANAVQSVSSSANHTGRTSHMRFIPGEATDITESATDDTIFIQYNVSVSSTAIPPCSGAPSAPSLIAGASTVCTGEPGAAYAVPPVSDATFYNWTVPSDAVITSGIGSNSINVIFGSTDGNVCASAYNDCGSSSALCQGVTINRPTSPGSITGTTPVCPGQTGVSYFIASVPGATNYIWTLPPGAVLASGTGSPSITVNFGSSGGDICVQTENSCGTSTPVCLPVVMTDTPATPGIITGSGTVCEGATDVSYSVSAVAEATSYNWTVPSGAAVSSGSGTEAITVDFGTASGTVCLTATSICGTSDPRCLSVIVNLAPVVTVDPSDITVDEDDPATFTVTATGASLSYQWQQSTDSGSSWANVGTDSDTYIIATATASMDGNQYRCIVSGSCSPSSTSASATLTVSTGLYDFTSHTFTNCGATGRYGPTLSNCGSYYSGEVWYPTYFSMSTQGIQEWTVPVTATYRIEVWGAQGATNGYGQTGALGARMRGDFSLTAGDVLKIVVGQQGSTSPSAYSASGGGGSFVVMGTSTPIIIAGGGGGRGSSGTSPGVAGTTSTSGTTDYSSNGTPGSAGTGGSTGGPGTGGGGGGGGLLTDGGPHRSNSGYPGYAFVNGAVGGSSRDSGSFGGFGCGGGNHESAGGGGAGGGYSGGAGGGDSPYAGGGGGGSFNGGTNQSNSAGVRSGHGQVTITKL